MDINNDKKISAKEMQRWIMEKTDEHFQEAVEENKMHFRAVDPDGDGKINIFFPSKNDFLHQFWYPELAAGIKFGLGMPSFGFCGKGCAAGTSLFHKVVEKKRHKLVFSQNLCG